jgi:2-desacetyl-2-hydroxyethyl bacteriochlorophyllide A dehydrogenase
MKHQTLYFTAPHRLEVRTEAPPQPASGQVLVRASCSAISPGTEMLFYRGKFIPDLPLDSIIDGLTEPAAYPIKYGYSMVGEVIELGEGVASGWLGRRVFVFHPHENLFAAAVESLMPVPENIPNEDAVFLPNMETAVNFIMDGAPLIGERVVVFGQGIIGLLTTSLLARFPLKDLVTLDSYLLRRQASLQVGAHASFDPSAQAVLDELKELLQMGADLTLEISGSPQALNQALAVTGFAGRVVIGSWYGARTAELTLGGGFHRSRIRLLSSQVSTIDPQLSARWNKSRRFDLVWQMIAELRPSRWITHRFPLEQAGQAYQLIDQHPEDSIQVLLTYA